jgi:RAQPRD family integrative conjugative element protein
MTPTRRPLLALVTAISALMLSATPSDSFADAQAERAELVRLLHELDSLEALIEKAEVNAISTQRIHFQYGWLRGDLAKIKAGIREYLDTVPATPRVPPPLAGDYIR